MMKVKRPFFFNNPSRESFTFKHTQIHVSPVTSRTMSDMLHSAYVSGKGLADLIPLSGCRCSLTAANYSFDEDPIIWHDMFYLPLVTLGPTVSWQKGSICSASVTARSQRDGGAVDGGTGGERGSEGWADGGAGGRSTCHLSQGDEGETKAALKSSHGGGWWREEVAN